MKEISNVAEIGGRVVGRIAVSPVTISDGTEDWYGAGPFSVLPEYYRKSGKRAAPEGDGGSKEAKRTGRIL